jgi:uncharacterized protein YidB (DUF937 family)
LKREEKVMALFDSFIEEARGRFELGDKANALLSALVALITDKNRGGFAGFLDRFDAAGLGDAASSWINSGASAGISKAQTEAALGPVTLDDISKQTGLDYETTVAASAFMLPQIVNELTPDGAIPADEDLLSRTREFLPETREDAAETFDRIGTAAVGTIDEKDEIMAEDFDEKEDNLKWILPLIIFALLVIFGFWFCRTEPKPAAPAKTTEANTNANVNVNK